jgi:membrane-associated phospholipid phosphatase
MVMVMAGAALATAVPAGAALAQAGPAGSARPAHRHDVSPFAPGTGQVVVDWNKTLISILGTPGAQPATVHPTRSFAILQAAEFDAVVSVTHAGRPYAIDAKVHGKASAAAAADQAARDVLAGLYPAQARVADAQLASELAAIPDGTAKTRGMAAGSEVAAKLLALRANDGSALTPPPFVPSTAPGDYQLTPPNFPPPVFTNWGGITPFVLKTGSQFRPDAPPPVTTAEYAQALAQVESLGQDTSTTRTAEQTTIGKFWGATPVWVVWNEVAQDQVAAHHSSLVKASSVFATLDLALADTAIGLYDAKYHFQVWRPVTAIRAGVQGSFTANPTWTPLALTAPDPSYPGAHSGFSFAAATVLTDFFGSPQVTVREDALAGQPRSFNGFFAAATEAALSRIYAGQHTPLDDHAGRVLGFRIASFVVEVLDLFGARE